MTEQHAKRYLGMTVLQLAILGCLGLIACRTIVGGFFLVTSTSGGFSLIPTPVPTSTPEPTSTPYYTPTPTYTPTATTIPYEELIPSGWKQYTTANIEIWLSPQFEPVDIEKERAKRLSFYKGLGYNDLAQQLQDYPPSYLFWFNATASTTTRYVTNITVETSLMNAQSLKEYLDQKYAQGPQEFSVVNRKDFSIGDYDAQRILLEANLSNVYIGVVQYAIFDGVNVWLISCSSDFNEFYTWLPEFDQVAQTFRFTDQ